MDFRILEKSFNRALLLSFSKKKLFLVFPVLLLCAILIVFCRAMAFNASGWIIMALIFLPIFLTSGILLALGVVIIRIYYHEAKSLKFHYREVLKKSLDVIVGTSYLSLPPVLAYLLLWVIFGIFVLLKEIPQIGQFIGVILSFAPFLIVLTSLILGVINLALLFFVAPGIALKSKEQFRLAKDVFEKFKKNIFSNVLFFIIGFIPIIFIVGILSLAAVITTVSYHVFPNSVSIAIQWFFISIPFCLFLTPSTVFFFNFAAEMYNLFQKKAVR